MNEYKTVDALNRPLRDLRISVIDQCNFRCSYCMPKEIFGDDYPFLRQDELLSFDEMERLIRIFVSLGVEKIRLTGGEPLLRKDLSLFIERINHIEGIQDIALTTNGVLLPKFAKQLKAAGLQRVNVSLDAMNDEIFGNINGRKVKVQSVLKGIDAAKEAGLHVKVNMVVIKGTNEQEIIPMIKYFKEKQITVRFIEYMDVGTTNGWDLTQVISKAAIVSMIEKEFPKEKAPSNYFGEVASRYQFVGSNAEFGVISSVTDSFCSSCTRARLSADGKLYTCLFAESGFDVRTLLRSGTCDDVISQSVLRVWEKRNDRYSDERLKNTNQGAKRKNKIEMSYIGG